MIFNVTYLQKIKFCSIRNKIVILVVAPQLENNYPYSWTAEEGLIKNRNNIDYDNYLEEDGH